jgi:hypothetical protein
MGREFRIVPGRREAIVPVASIGPGLHAVRPSPLENVSDQVSLSRLYTAVQSSETAHRLHTLGIQVAQRTYWIPATEIGRSLILESQIAA